MSVVYKCIFGLFAMLCLFVQCIEMAPTANGAETKKSQLNEAQINSAIDGLIERLRAVMESDAMQELLNGAHKIAAEGTQQFNQNLNPQKT